MSESLIFSSPFVLTLYIVALAMMVFDRKTNASKGVITLLAAVIVIGDSSYALLHGAGAFEIAGIIGLFLVVLLSMIREEKK